VISSRTARSCRWLGWARGELVEVRAADLRFTPDEVATYLGTAAGFSPEYRRS
jgi:ATP/maltotriose-dependent transcriptional regulator MalT